LFHAGGQVSAVTGLIFGSSSHRGSSPQTRCDHEWCPVWLCLLMATHAIVVCLLPWRFRRRPQHAGRPPEAPRFQQVPRAARLALAARRAGNSRLPVRWGCVLAIRAQRQRDRVRRRDSRVDTVLHELAQLTGLNNDLHRGGVRALRLPRAIFWRICMTRRRKMKMRTVKETASSGKAV
jgi:hypothetical protein